MPTTGRGSVGCGRSTVAACAGRTRARTTLDIIARSGLESSREPIDVKFVEPTAEAAVSAAMTAMGTDFENSFRRFLAQPDTQEVVAEEQKKELAVMEKANELEKLEELQGQREQLAVALQDLDPETQRPRGFGFVNLELADEGAAAVAALNGYEVFGRQLSVSEGKNGPPEGRGRGRGRGRGDGRGRGRGDGRGRGGGRGPRRD